MQRDHAIHLTGAVNATGNNNAMNVGDDNFTILGGSFNSAEGDGNHDDVVTMAKSQTLYKVAMSFNMYYPPVLIVVGLLGNSLSLLVMLQRNNRKFSCCVYLAGLAVGDNLFMLHALHLWVMTALFPQHFSNEHCTVVAYSFQVRTPLFVHGVVARIANVL